MNDLVDFDGLISQFSRLDAMGLPMVDELSALRTTQRVDLEMAVVRARRVVEMIAHRVFAKHTGAPAGTRSLERLLSELEKSRAMPRRVVAYMNAIKGVANICAHEHYENADELSVCLEQLTFILKWFVRHAESLHATSPNFHAIDGIEAQAHTDDVIRKIIEIDRSVFADSDEESFGCLDRSRTWYDKNPSIYTLLYCGPRLVGYANIMPLEDDAWELAIHGKLHDGTVQADAIRRFELPGRYRVYVCCIAILQEFRRFRSAFGTLYDKIFDKFLRLAEDEIYVSEIAANAWTIEGQSMSRSLGMTTVGTHCRHGEVYHSTIVPPQLDSPSKKMRLLLSRYRHVGLIDAD